MRGLCVSEAEALLLRGWGGIGIDTAFSCFFLWFTGFLGFSVWEKVRKTIQFHDVLYGNRLLFVMNCNTALLLFSQMSYIVWIDVDHYRR